MLDADAHPPVRRSASGSDVSNGTVPLVHLEGEPCSTDSSTSGTTSTSVGVSGSGSSCASASTNHRPFTVQRSGLEVMGDTQHAEPNWHARAEEHRQMARAAIRVVLKHGIHENEILDEFGRVQIEEARGA